MLDQILTVFLGRAPTDEDRAIYVDQTARLTAVLHNPLLPATDGLQAEDPFPDHTP